MEVSKIIFAICVAVLLLGQLAITNPVGLREEYVTGQEVQLANEISQALVKLMADINKHTRRRSRARRYITFTIGSDYYKPMPRRSHHRRWYHQPHNSTYGNQLVSQ